MPQVLTSKHSCVCFLPTGAKATCISPQRAVFEKTLAALDPLGCLTIYIFSNVILSPYLLTPTITTQVCEKQNKKKKASFFCQQGCDEAKLAVCWDRRVAPGLSWMHMLVSCSIPLRFPCCRARTSTGPRVPRLGRPACSMPRIVPAALCTHPPGCCLPSSSPREGLLYT